MLADVRSLLPTDLLLLVARAGTGYVNESWPRERLGCDESPATLTMLRDQLLAFGGRRGTWVSVRRQRLQGLVGARRRGGAQAWEIDYLIDGGAGTPIIAELLTRAVAATGESGAEKLFVRLDVQSALMPAMREAAFLSYQRELLYVRESGIDIPPAELRQATPADSYPLFRLYNATVPEATRRYEAATYGEWLASRERRWLRNGVQLVGETAGAIDVAVRASRLPQGVLLDLTLGNSHMDAPSLVAAGARAAGGATEPLLVTVPLSNEGLARQLEAAGFTGRGEFVSLVHRTTRPLPMPKMAPKMVPTIAKNAIGV